MRSSLARGAAPDKSATAAHCLILYGMLINLVLPVYLGGMSDVGAFPEARLGLLANAIAAGMAVSTIGLAPWMGRIDRRLVGAIALLLSALINLASCFVVTFEVILLLRFADGVAAGALLGIGFAQLSMQPSPERQFSINFVLQVLLQVIGQAGVPRIFAAFGVAGFHATVLLFVPAVFLSMMHVRSRAPSLGGAGQPGSGSQSSLKVAAWALAANAIFYVYVTPIYTFSERIGAGLGLGAERLGIGLGLTTLAGVLGSFAAMVLADRQGRRVPLVAGVPVALLPCFLLLRPESEAFYWLGLALFSITWSFYLPYLLGLVAIADPAGRFMSAAQGLPFVTGIMGVAAAEASAAGTVLEQVPIIAAWGFALTLIVALVATQKLSGGQLASKPPSTGSTTPVT